jgi:hypothetical protein
MQSLFMIKEALVVVTRRSSVSGVFSGTWLSVERCSLVSWLAFDRVAVVLRDALRLGDWAWVVL